MTSATPFAISIQGYSGPLDVLLRLVELRELDITTLSLANVADEFLEFTRGLDRVDAEELSHFIVIAARLIQIKSFALLPAREQPRAEEIEADAEELADRLREYQAIKATAQSLRQREDTGLRSFSPIAPVSAPAAPRPRGGDTNDLVAALRRVVASALRAAPVERVEREKFSIGDKIADLRGRCADGERIRFGEILQGRSRGEIVATFLAVLELLRLDEIDARQHEQFGDIVIVASNAR